MPWKGAWDSGTSYMQYDVVRAADNAVYSCAMTNIGHDPANGANPTYWNLMLQGVPPGGSTSDYLIKNSGTDYDASFGSIFKVDAPYSDVKLLLGCDGSGTITDFETTPKTIGTSGTVTTSSSIKKFANNSIDLRSGFLTFATDSDFAANGASPNAFTWETWVYMTAFSGSDDCFFDNRGSAGTPGLVFFANSLHQLCFYDGTAKGYVGSGITLNAWHHVAISAENGLAGLFLDGVMQSSPAIGNAGIGSSTTFKVGRRNDGTLGAAGYYDQVRVTQGVARYKPLINPTFGTPSAAFPTS